MKRSLQSVPSSPEQPQRDTDVVTRPIESYPDVLYANWRR